MSDYKYIQKYLKYKSKYNNLKYGGHGARFDGPHRLDAVIKNREKRMNEERKEGEEMRSNAYIAGIDMNDNSDFNRHLRSHLENDDNLRSYMRYERIHPTPDKSAPRNARHYLHINNISKLYDGRGNEI